ncbi:MAG: dipeptidase [Christensenellales bacterium]|jgi:dipeptidase|nr:peptidase C69 [Clostridiales bacterium]
MKKRLAVLTALLLVLMMATQGVLACTIVSVGKEAMADGSTVSTHNDDSTSADFRLWIIPSMKGGEGVTRDIVLDSHNYGDYSDFPNTKDYGNGFVVGELPQPNDTYAHFHSRYSFINEKGVAMGEATFSYDRGFRDSKVYELIYGKNDGLIDCWNAQDIALERAATAKEAVEIMGKLCEDYLWKDYGETINVCDGTEVWVFEAYGLDLWAAVRLPENAFFVAANRARICEFDFEDKENYLCSPNLKSFAVENELWSEDSGVPFSPAEIYAPCDGDYSVLREWRAFDLVAPSLGLKVSDRRFPLYVVPDKKLTVRDIFDIKGDYYQGTEYDISRTAYAGDFGNPLNYNAKYRTINMYRTCYLMLANVKEWLPDEVKCLVWYGYGAPHSSFLTPLWPSMTEVADVFSHGSRYEKFDRTAGWWISTYVQDMAARNYNVAIERIAEVRDERMANQVEEVSQLQEKWAKMIADGQRDEAVAELTKYANESAEAWFADWLALGDELVWKLVWNRVNQDGRITGGGYSDWYKTIMEEAPLKPIE